MWKSQYETITDVSQDQLFSALQDIQNWKEWDDEIEWAQKELQEPIQKGTCFILKPKGGPKVRLSIEEFSPPSLFVDIAYLPLAKMRTTHEFLQSGPHTIIRFTIEIWGVLGFLWRKFLGEKQIQSAPKQIASFIQYAKRLRISSLKEKGET